MKLPFHQCQRPLKRIHSKPLLAMFFTTMLVSTAAPWLAARAADGLLAHYMRPPTTTENAKDINYQVLIKLADDATADIQWTTVSQKSSTIMWDASIAPKTLRLGAKLTAKFDKLVVIKGLEEIPFSISKVGSSDHVSGIIRSDGTATFHKNDLDRVNVSADKTAMHPIILEQGEPTHPQ